MAICSGGHLRRPPREMALVYNRRPLATVRPGQGLAGEGEATTMHDAAGASIDALMTSFLEAVSFKAGEQPRYGELPALFGPHARLIRTSGPAPEISSPDEFVRTRQSAVDAGDLTSFQETELAHRTEHFGNVAHRFSSYAKRGTTNHGPIDVRGAISTQFIRTEAGWRISSMAWDDERDA